MGKNLSAQVVDLSTQVVLLSMLDFSFNDLLFALVC